MLAYTIRRIGIAFITFVLASVLIFAIIQLPPGDFATYVIGQTGDMGGQGAFEARLRTLYGLDQPLHTQYLKWFLRVLRGDLGYSFLYQKSVVDVIRSEIGWTVLITGVSLALAWLFGMMIGIFSAIRKYSVGDYAFTLIGFLGVSIPPFFLALALVYWMISAGTGISGGLFSSQYLTAPWGWGKLLDLLRHIWIPIVAIGTANVAQVIRIMRGSLLEVIDQPYVQTARAKGLKEWIVIIKHAVRIAVNPLISLAGLMAPKLVSGIVVTAVVLNLPVIGPTFVEALKSQDMYLAGAYLLLTVALLLIGNILADLALAWSDPRIRLE